MPADVRPRMAAAIADWFRREARDLPWRRPGFPAWGTLVSEVMLQQTPVVRVVPRLETWLARWPTAADLAAVPASEAIRAWSGLGYPRRALALHAAATAIVDRHGGRVPDDLEALLALPGVGPYTARAVAAFGHGRRHPVVDVNVRRVLVRALAGHPDAGAPSARRDLDTMAALLPKDPAESVVVNAGTMELGAVVCTARSPRCDACPIAEWCAWRAAGYPAAHPDHRPARRQARFEGSDRQVRGLVLRALEAAELPVARPELDVLWPDAAQLDRAVRGLERDGLIRAEPDSDAWTLPL